MDNNKEDLTFRLEVKLNESLTTISLKNDLEDIRKIEEDIIKRVDIHIYEVDEVDEIVGDVFEGVLFLMSDNNFINDIIDAADEMDEDTHKYALYLNESKQYHKTKEDYEDIGAFFDWGVNVVSGALHRFYVYPKYRRLGIGETLFNYIDKIIESKVNLKIRCLVTYPNPDKGQEEGLKEEIIKLIKKNGFHHIKDNYYIKEYIK